MTRQNCKNCGEPYSFDNLVTPGRATMVCGACSKKIYTHTGQIYFESPTSTKKTSPLPVSIGNGIAFVPNKETPIPAPGIPSMPAANLKSTSWKRANFTEKTTEASSMPAMPTHDVNNTTVRTEEITETRHVSVTTNAELPARAKLNLCQKAFVIILYLVALGWFSLAVRPLTDLFSLNIAFAPCFLFVSAGLLFVAVAAIFRKISLMAQ